MFIVTTNISILMLSSTVAGTRNETLHVKGEGSKRLLLK